MVGKLFSIHQCQPVLFVLLCVLSSAFSEGDDFQLKRVLFLFSASSLDQISSYSSKLVTEDSDAVALVCNSLDTSEERTSKSREVFLPCFLPVASESCRRGWHDRPERLFYVENSSGLGIDTYFAHGCANDGSELLLLLAAATKQRYAFYVPVNDTAAHDLFDLPVTLPSKYAERQFRLQMVQFSSQAVEQRIHDLLAQSQSAAGDGDHMPPSEPGEFDNSSGTDPDGAVTRAWRKRFVYMLTGEKESEYKDLDRMAGPDSDVILCVWGEPEDQRPKECWEECTGDWPKVCHQVCVLPPADPASPFSYIYVRGSSFQQGRNHLMNAAQRAGGYAYYIFLVDDIEVLERDFGVGLATGNPYRIAPPTRWTLEGYLILWQPAMAVPAAVRRDEDPLLDPSSEVSPVYGWDHLLHAVHRDAAPVLFPYSLGFESVSWWYSEFVMNLAAAAFFDAAHILQFNAIYAQTFRAGYVGYPHASDFRVPLSWFVTAVGSKRQLDALHFHEHTCISPKEFGRQAAIKPRSLSYSQALAASGRTMECHPFFSDRGGLSGRAECRAVDAVVSEAVVAAMEAEERRNGTVCGWCMQHPRSPETSNCANRLSGTPLREEVAGGAAQARLFSPSQQLRLGVRADGTPLE